MSWGDVLKMNPADGAQAGPEDAATRCSITSMAGSITVTAQAVGRRAPRHRGQVLRPGPLGLRPRGRQGLRQGAPHRRQQQRDPGR
ncbi:MAG: hypothetical protein MZU91_12340 [Desulfosudis oleivorans]|nr:hypothetical protein [Desulfosudis oleivorans]